MIYFLLVASVLAVQNGAVLEMTGDAPTVHFGELGGSDVLTLIHNATEDELVCSGKIRASDVLIEGTSTTVADLISKVGSLEHDVAVLKESTSVESAGMYPIHFGGVSLNLGNYAQIQLDGCDTMTYELWFRPTSSEARGWPVLKNAANGLRLDSPTQPLQFYQGNYCTGTFSSWSINTWYHLAVVKSGCSGTLYINGSPDKTCTGIANPGDNLPLVVGEPDGSVASSGFDVAELRYWGVARTVSQLTAGTSSALNVSEFSQAELRGYWRFEDSSQLQKDSSLWARVRGPIAFP